VKKKLTLKDKANKSGVAVIKTSNHSRVHTRVYFNKEGKNPLVQVSKRIYIDGLTLEAAIATMMRESENLVGSRLAFEAQGSHDLDVDVFIHGYRDATKEETRLAEKDLLDRINQDYFKEQEELERAEKLIRTHRPELLKDENA